MSTDDIQARAADWLSREDAGMTAHERQELADWLGQSTKHMVCYLRLQAAWERADRLSALSAPMRPAPTPTRRWPPAVLISVLAATILIAVTGYYLSVRPDGAQTYQTAVGSTQSLQLVDGSRVQLNSNTRLRTAFSDKQRFVTLDEGEAYFEVVHDVQRPFVVLAGKKRVTDLGTKFSVYRNGDDVRVVVTEGRVTVEAIEEGRGRGPVLAESGNVVITKGSETLVSAKPESEIVDDLSWRTGVLVFTRRPLAEAAEEFNRYNTKRLVIEGNARNMLIGGRFKANNVDSFVLLLHRGFGLTIDDRGNTVVVSR